MKTLIYITPLIILFLQGCSRLPISPEKSLRKLGQTGYFKDDLKFKGLKISLKNTIKSLDSNPDKEVTIINEVFTQKELSDALKILVKCSSTKDQLNQAINRYFQP